MFMLNANVDPFIFCNYDWNLVFIIGVRAGGARGAAAPPKFGQLRFFGQQEKIWAKPVFKDVSMFIIIIIIIIILKR